MLRGNAARVCQGDATWSGEEPKCYLDRNIGKVISFRSIFTLKAPRKNTSELSSAEVVCCKKLPSKTHELSIEANSVVLEQTAPIAPMGPHCLPLRLLKHFSRLEKQTTFVAIGALRFEASF